MHPYEEKIYSSYVMCHVW